MNILIKINIIIVIKYKKWHYKSKIIKNMGEGQIIIFVY